VEERRRRGGALPRFSAALLRLRVLAGSSPALERRRIAHPKAQDYADFQSWDYSRDLRPEKWGSGVSLHGSNPEPLMSAWVKSGLMHCSKFYRYSITWSACASSAAG